MVTTKTCLGCGDAKPLEAFSVHKNCAHGRHPRCKPCRKIARKDEWPNLRDRVNPERRAQRRADPSHDMFHAAKKRAKEVGVPFTIGLGDISVPEVCPILGAPLVTGDGRPHAASPSLDRIDPVLGYVPGNVCVISYRANRIKNDASLDELEAVAAYVRAQTRR